MSLSASSAIRSSLPAICQVHQPHRQASGMLLRVGALVLLLAVAQAARLDAAQEQHDLHVLGEGTPLTAEFAVVRTAGAICGRASAGLPAACIAPA